jgi:parallel beta-helix repeat protein
MFPHFIGTVSHYPKTALSPIKQVCRLLLLSFFLVIPAYAHAITYYVDSTAGDDSYTGTAITTPWKTIAKVNGRTFLPGDFVLFKSGCIWREQLTVPSSGTAGNPITFGAYSSGGKPVISGADTVGTSGWTLYSGNIYVTTVGSITPPNQLYVDGTYYDVARHPNRGWLLATANSMDTTSIIDTNFTLPADQVVGATIMVQAVPWSVTTSTATAYDSATHKLTLTAPVYDTSLVMLTGYGYYLQDKLWMLDSPGEWYFDPVAGRLYLWAPAGDSPVSHTVEVSNRSYGVLNYGKDYVTIEDLAITKANWRDVNISGAKNVIIKKLEVSGGKIGVYVVNTSNSSLNNNWVQNTLSTGILLDTKSNNYIDILNNTINNAGNVGLSPRMSLAGIYATGSMLNVKNNTVINSGYIGIRIEGSEIVVENNTIDRSCLVFNDCGGIYTFGRYTGDIHKTISGNTVTNSIGNFSGTPKKSTQAQGIYLDDFAHDTSVLNNVISNADYGIFIHAGHNNTVIGNTVYSSRSYALLINENIGAPGVAHDNVVSGNTFETISIGATASYYSLTEPLTNFGTYDYNRYYHPNSDYVVSNQFINYSLLSWRQVSGQDLNSTDSKSYAPRRLSMPQNFRIK